MPDQTLPINVTVNGAEHGAGVEPRLLLTDFLRHRLRLTGTHVGCEHGGCGRVQGADRCNLGRAIPFDADLDGATARQTVFRDARAFTDRAAGDSLSG